MDYVNLPGSAGDGNLSSLPRPPQSSFGRPRLDPALIDLREQLVNDAAVGPIEQVSLPEAMITSLRGILLDFDPRRLRGDLAPPDVMSDPELVYHHIIRPMLARHPVLAKAEVRMSGQGLHAIIRLNPSVEFSSSADRQRWAPMVRVIQRLLPTDPDCPGITALTRPLGSLNGKNGAVVRQLHTGEPVSPDEIIALFDELRSRPFKLMAGVLFGLERMQPCPVCRHPESTLTALDQAGTCYGRCGKVKLAQLYNCYLKDRLHIEPAAEERKAVAHG